MRRRKDARSESSVELVSLEVIERCRRGDERAWRQLVESTQRDVYTLCLRILRDPDDAAEATQDTYLKAWRGLGGFRGEAMFTTWLYRVATNAAISRQRSRARRRSKETTGDDVLSQLAGPGSIESATEARLDVEVLEDELAKLPEIYRSAVVLRDVYGLGIAEIAERLKISETAAKVRVHRGRKMLKQTIYGSREEG